MIRAKFTCQDNVLNHETQIAQIVLTPVISGSQENLTFWKATPAGAITLQITNPEASAQFTPGTDYYVDFTVV